MQALIDAMNRGAVVALGDLHTNSRARELTAALIESGHVQVFFMEWPDQAGLSQKMTELLQAEASEEEALEVLRTGPYFNGAALGDARPSLIELTALAIGRGVEVAPCDLSSAVALQRIDAFREIEEYPHRAQPTVLFDDEGLSVRDDHAASAIGKVACRHEAGRLMLWGDKHFEDYDNRYLKPRYHLRSPDERFDIFSNNLRRKLLTTRCIGEVVYVPNAQIPGYAD